MQTCQVCGKQNPAGVEYCEDCGAALKATPAQAAPAVGGAAGPPGAAAPDAAAAPAASQTPGVPAPADPGPPPVAPPPAAGDAGAAGATSGAAPAGGRPRLEPKRYGALTGDEVPLLGERLVVGRFDPETGPVDIDLTAAPEAEHISRQHGELYREADGRWLVRDLGSANGIFVKGASDAAFGPRLAAPRELADGDEVAFGNARFVFRND